MQLSEREVELAMQQASPKTIVHQGRAFTATLIKGTGGTIRLDDNRPGTPHGIVTVAFDHAPHDPGMVFGYALSAHPRYDTDRPTIKNGLTLEHAIAACCEAILAAREEYEQRAELERQGRNRIYEWYIQAPLQE